MHLVGRSKSGRLVVVGLSLSVLGVLLSVVPAGGQESSRLVSGVSVSEDGVGAVVVSWTPPAAAPVDYRVVWAREDLDFLSYRYEDEPERGNAYPAGSRVSVRLEGLTPGAVYKASVRARYGPGRQGPWSDHASGTAGASDDSDGGDDDGDGDDDGGDDDRDGDDDGGDDDGDGDDGGDDDDDGQDNDAGDGQDNDAGDADGGIAFGDGDGFDLVGVMSVGSAWVGDQEVLGYSLRGGGVGSFETTGVGDARTQAVLGARGFLNGLMRVPGRYEISSIGEYDDGLVLMIQFGLASPFLLEVGGRLYSSASASASNVRGYSDKFWVWEDPCARWAVGEEVAVWFDDGATSDAVLRSADASLASLGLTGAVLGEGFSPAVLDYAATAGDGVSQITIDAAAADANACSVEISPADADEGAAGHQVDVDAEDGAAVTVAVTAGDGATTAVYAVTVAAGGGALPAAATGLDLDGVPGLGFDPQKRRYDEVVPSGTTSTTVSVRRAPGTTVHTTAYRTPPTPAPVAPPAPKSPLVRSSPALASTNGGRGAPQQEDVDAGGRVELPPGRDTLVVVKTSTEGGEREEVYTARLRPAGFGAAARSGSLLGPKQTVTDPRLSALSITPGTLSPAFASTTFEYAVAVGSGTGVVTVSATGAAGVTATVAAPDADTATAGHQVALNANGPGRGSQTAFVVLVAKDGKLDSYTITVNRAAGPSDDAALSALTLNSGTLVPAFDPATASYSVAVASNVSQLTVTATAGDSDASVAITPADSGTASGHQVGLSTGDTAIAVTVTAEDGTTARVYDIVATRPSNDTTLSALSLSEGTLSPSFNSVTSAYTASVRHSTGQITVEAAATAAAAAVAVSPSDADPIAAGHQIDVAAPPAGSSTAATTAVTVTVTSSDGMSTGTHTVTVSRPPPPPPAGGEITLELPDACTLKELGDTDVTPRRRYDPTADWDWQRGRWVRRPYCHKIYPYPQDVTQHRFAAHFYRLMVADTAEFRLRVRSSTGRSVLAVYTASGELIASDARARSVWPGSRRHDGRLELTLERGQYVVEVANALSANPNYTDTYSLAVSGETLVRQSEYDLLDLDVSGVDLIGFEPGVRRYTRWVADDVSRVTVTAAPRRSDANVVISPPDADTITTGHQVDLDADGETEITVAAAPPEMIGSWHQYTLRLVEVPDTTSPLTANDATLSSLSLSGVNFGAFDSAQLHYAHTLDYTVNPDGATATLSATTTQSSASWTANRADIDTVTDGWQVRLDGGETIKVKVTSADGRHANTYTIAIREPSHDTTLGSLAVSVGEILPKLNPAVSDYTASVPSTSTAFTLAATANHPAASAAITPADADTGTPGHQITLTQGDNTATVTVTAEDGTTTRAFTVTVTRAAAPTTDATLSAITISDGRTSPTISPAIAVATTDYAATVHPGSDRFTVDVLTSTSNATAVISPPDADPAAAGHQIDIAAPPAGTFETTTVAVVVAVTAANSTTRKTYTITVTRPTFHWYNLPRSTYLSSLEVSGTDIKLSRKQSAYVAVVAPAATTATVSAPAADRRATVEILPADADSNTDGHQVSLGAGSTTVSVTVANDWKSRLYTVTLNNAVHDVPANEVYSLDSLSVGDVDMSGFKPGVRRYTRLVAADVSSVTVAGSAPATDAVIAISPADADSVTAGHQVALDADGETEITVTVSHSVAVLSRYTVTLVRLEGSTNPLSGDATLSGLSLSGVDLGPFSAATLEYHYPETFYERRDTSVSDLVFAAAHSGATWTVSPPDADKETPGHQFIRGGVGAPVEIVVTSQDTLHRRRYLIRRAPVAADSLTGCALCQPGALGGTKGGLSFGDGKYVTVNGTTARLFDAATGTKTDEFTLRTWSRQFGKMRTFWSDGDDLWVIYEQTPAYRTRPSRHYIYRYRLVSRGTIASNFVLLHQAQSHRSPHIAMWGDGKSLYVLDKYGKLRAYSNKTRALTSTVTLEGSSWNASSRSMWSDGSTLWVADCSSIKAFDLRTGSRRPSLDIATTRCDGLWGDGATLWTADGGKLVGHTLGEHARLNHLKVDGYRHRFQSGVFEFSQTVGNLRTMTIEARAAFTGGSSSIAYSAPDVNPRQDGHQVALTPGQDTTVTVTVTAPNGTDTETYTIHLTRRP